TVVDGRHHRHPTVAVRRSKRLDSSLVASYRLNTVLSGRGYQPIFPATQDLHTPEHSSLRRLPARGKSLDTSVNVPETNVITLHCDHHPLECEVYLQVNSIPRSNVARAYPPTAC